jgi:hypothetical protein
VTANDELKRMWKEVIMTGFKELTQHLPHGTKENHKKRCQSEEPVLGPRFEP